MSETTPNTKPEKGGGKLREFGLTTLSIQNKTTVFVLIAIITLSGISSYLSVPKEAFPEIVVPEIFVSTAYPGNSPANMEKLITRPLEKEINTISGIDEITSTSVQGFSAIDIKFNFDVTPTEALRKVKDAVDKAKADPDFPTDLPADPSIMELNFSELMPVMNINLSGDYRLQDLKKYAEYLEEKVEALPQISKVDIQGISDLEVEIEVDYLRAEAMQVSFNDIAGAIAAENMTVSGGDLLVDGVRRSVQVEGDFTSIEELENVIIKAENGFIVHLRDVAHVAFVEKEKESYAREYLRPVVSLDVVKRAGENLLEASSAINAIIEEAKRDVLPRNLNVSITNDQSDMTQTQVEELQNSIIFGVLLVVGVLLFFLGLRNALFVGVAIPLSMFMSFLILNSLGVTFNTMVLFSLVLALGMLVDNGIVVVENVYRLMDEGYSPFDAAKYGVGEVAWPIVASTATTLAAFLPLAMWPGLIGEFMSYLPLTLIIVLGSSLFVALVINPVLTSVLMKVGEEHVNRRRAHVVSAVLIGVGALFLVLGATGLGNVLVVAGGLTLLNLYVLTPTTRFFQNALLPRLEEAYERFLKYALSGWRPWAFFFGTVGLLFLSVVLMGLFPPKVLFFPDNQPQYLNIFISKPIGTDLEETNEVAKEIEHVVLDVLARDEWKRPNPETGELESFMVNSVIGTVGNGTSDPNEGPQLGPTPHKARIVVNFVKFQDRRGLATGDVLSAIREELRGYPDAEVVVTKNSDGPPQGAPINLELVGDDYDELLTASEEVLLYLRGKDYAGVEELKIDVDKRKPQMPVSIDREKARAYGLSTRDIGYALRTALFGREVGTYKDGEDDYPINVRFSEEYRHSSDALMNQKVIFRSQSDGQIKEVPISAVATASRATTFSAVKRKDLKRVITMTSNVLEGANPTEIIARMEADMTKDLQLPSTVSWAFTGQQEEQQKEMAFLSKALLIALFLIFLIIVSQFNSITTPFIIGFSVFFSLIGVLLGLVIFQMEFVIIMTMIGIISLAGVVVNNAIVLIDYTDLLRARQREALGLEEGETRDAVTKLPFPEVEKAIVQGGKTRLRPVLLTAITTVLGLLPLAIGLNIDFVGLMTEYSPNIYVGGDNNVFWKPMSWAIIFGLTFATFLTLVIVPVMYWWIERSTYRLAGRKV
ncbi:MAG: efflux RND transporter permease subunit [Bacteroidetes bacterium]|nr:efflux RND transporter permease subunit [Bacteroidota bacterium]MDA1242458.1 efflux RND transporter permease subunit [Bacteroidota bacterium]